MHNKIIVFLLTVLFVATSCKDESKETAQTEPNKQVTYEANWESIKANYKDPEWFNQKKFGIFIHWGAYAVPAFGSEWYPRNMYMDSTQFTAELKLQSNGPSSVNKHHVETYGNLKDFGYKDFIPMFKGENFDAAEWIDLFKKAGAKFAGPVAEHHDGFAMWDSKVNSFNHEVSNEINHSHIINYFSIDVKMSNDE